MDDRNAKRLLALLADYAEAYGRDFYEGLTVKALADDITESLGAYDAVAENDRDRVYNGLNQ